MTELLSAARKILAAADGELTAANAVQWGAGCDPKTIGYMLGQEIRRREVSRTRQPVPTSIRVEIQDDDDGGTWNAVSGGY